MCCEELLCEIMMRSSARLPLEEERVIHVTPLTMDMFRVCEV